MTILDARDLEPDVELTADVCVVGAGAAGLTIAGELERSGREVCVLEGGGFQPEQATQVLHDLDSRGYPIRRNFMSRARYYGGSCNLWAGRSMRFLPRDLEPRSWVPDSGWPIPYSELLAYYPRASRILGLPAFDQFEEGRHEDALSAGERALYGGEAIDPTVSLWARRPKRFGAAHKSALRSSRTTRLVLHANAIKVHLNPEGTSVESVEAATLGRNHLRVRARVVVLACGGLENPRLLLLSRDGQECGIGNRYDVVGRYFMDHPRAVFGKVRLREGVRLSLLEGCPISEGSVQFGLGLSRHVQRTEGLLDHYATLEVEHSEYTEKGYQSFIRTMKVLLRRGHAGRRWEIGGADMGDIAGLLYLLTPRELVPHGLYRAYWHARKALTAGRSARDRVVVYFCEQPPDPESRVTLSRERDALGANRLVLNWKIASEVARSARRLQAVLQQRLERTGLGELDPGTGELMFTDASHHMGTTRMSVSPRTGVVDTECRVHGVHGLYVAGSSVFPSASHKNPTLTIVALALRLADHLKRRPN